MMMVMLMDDDDDCMCLLLTSIALCDSVLYHCINAIYLCVIQYDDDNDDDNV